MSDSNSNRIRLKVQQEATPISLQDQVGLKAQIKVDVETHLTGLGVFGVFFLALGAVLLIGGSLFWVTIYPEEWGGYVGDDSSFTKTLLVEQMWGFGFTFLMLGTAMFFYGRTVLGSGGLQQLESLESLGRDK